MPKDRSEIAGSLLNNKIYISGWFENGHSTDTLQVYDPIIDKWSTVTPLSQPLVNTSVAISYNGKLYVIDWGYLDRNILSNKLFIYDSDRWTQGANLPEARGTLTANFINGILFVGGVNSTETLTSTLAYDRFKQMDIWKEHANSIKVWTDLQMCHLTIKLCNWRRFITWWIWNQYKQGISCWWWWKMKVNMYQTFSILEEWVNCISMRIFMEVNTIYYQCLYTMLLNI